MPLDSLERLFVEELRDVYYAEKALVRALGKMAKNASDEALVAAFEEHRTETEEQVKRLEQVFDTLDLKPRGKTCHGIRGIIEEGEEMMEEEGDESVLDAGLIAGAQRAEHYEMAAYGTLRHYAERLGNRKAEQLLAQTLEEEKAADAKLNEIAIRLVNPKAQKE